MFGLPPEMRKDGTATMGGGMPVFNWYSLWEKGGTPHKRQLADCFEITCTGCEITRTPCESTRTHTCDSTFTIRVIVNRTRTDYFPRCRLFV